MADVHQELLAAFEATRKRPLTFQSERDQVGQDRFVREQVTKLGASVVLIPRVTQREPKGSAIGAAGVDTLDADILDPQFVEKSVKYDVRCLIEHNPSQQRLTKYGIDEQRDVVFHFVASHLRDLGLVEEGGKRFRGVAIGDVVVWDGTFYIVREAHRTSYLGLTDYHYFTSAFAMRYSHNTHSRNISATPEPRPYVTDVRG